MNADNHKDNRIAPELVRHASQCGKWSMEEIGKFRSELLRNCPQFDHPAMTRFVSSCFESDVTVGAYFEPMYLQVLTRDRVLTGKTIKTIPFTHAVRAAGAAKEMALISCDTEHQKRLAFLVTLLAPASLFLNVLAAHRYVAGASKPLNQHLGELRSQILLKPLQELFKWDRESAALLATLLGFTSSISVDQKLFSRMEAASCLATLSIKAIWRATDPKPISR